MYNMNEFLLVGWALVFLFIPVIISLQVFNNKATLFIKEILNLILYYILSTMEVFNTVRVDLELDHKWSLSRTDSREIRY